MTALKLPSQEDAKLTPDPKRDVDRKALREQLSKRYENTLRRLGR